MVLYQWSIHCGSETPMDHQWFMDAYSTTNMCLQLITLTTDQIGGDVPRVFCYTAMA